MIEQMLVLYPAALRGEASDRKVLAEIAAEFPSIYVGFAAESDVSVPAHVCASQWSRPDFDSWQFDVAIDELARAPLTLTVLHDDDGHSEFPLETLNRCQRWVDRRNRHSQGPLFDRVLLRHRALHDLDKPLVRADYNHALDVWQWLLRLEPNASQILQFAALFHDVERIESEADARIEQHAPSYVAFKEAHARAGAELTRRILRSCGVSPPECDRVAKLVAAHEQPNAEPENALLNDADALSVFSLNANGYADYFGPLQTRKKIAYTWNRLRPESRGKLACVALRPDVRAMLDDVRRA